MEIILIIRYVLRDVTEDLVSSLSFSKFLNGLFSPFVGVSFFVGLFGIFFDATVFPSLWRLMIGAIVEELAFRTLIQRELESLVPGIFFSRISIVISYGCLMSSVLFAVLHIFSSPPHLALLTFFPSLIMGAIWTKFRSTWLCALLHLWFNVVFFYF